MLNNSYATLIFIASYFAKILETSHTKLGIFIQITGDYLSILVMD